MVIVSRSGHPLEATELPQVFHFPIDLKNVPVDRIFHAPAHGDSLLRG